MTSILKILDEHRNEPLSVCEIMKLSGKSEHKVKEYLNNIKKNGFLDITRDGDTERFILKNGVSLSENDNFATKNHFLETLKNFLNDLIFEKEIKTITPNIKITTGTFSPENQRKAQNNPPKTNFQTKKDAQNFLVYFYIILICLIILVPFIILESYFRLFNPQQLLDECSGENLPSLVIANESVGYLRRPNMSVCMYQVTNKKIRFTQNNQGFRMNRDVSIKKPNDVIRIILLGDSFTEGGGVDDGETYDAQLTKLLPTKYEVINMGRSGTGTAQQLPFLKEVGLKLSPDIVILFFYQNDFYDNINSYPRYELNSDGTLNPKMVTHLENFTAPKKSGFFYGLFKKHFHTSAFFDDKYKQLRLQGSSIKQLFNRLFKRISAEPPNLDSTIDSMMAVYTPNMKYSLFMTFALFNELKKLSEKNNFKLVVVNIPSKWQFNIADTKKSLNNYEQESYLAQGLIPNKVNTIFSLFFRQAGIQYLDLFYDREFSNRYQEMYFRNDGHTSPKGAEVISRAVYTKLVSDGIIDINQVV